MLTRCPACATTFRVTPEQLKIRRGTVRCGACAQVFNGIDQLVEDPFVAPTVARAGSARPEVQPSPPSQPAAAQRSETSPVAPEGMAVATSDGATLDFDLTEPGAAPERLRPAVEAGADAVPPSLTFDGPPAAAPSDMPPADPAAGQDDATPKETIEPMPADGADAASTSAAEAPGPTRAATPLRWPWTAGVTLVAILLTLQALIHYRVELATLSPESRPFLAALCDGLGCSVGLPARVDLVGIEASDLIPDPVQKGRLTLAATLRNRAPFAQAHPLLELTLTDNANAAVARKVLGPADYLPKDADPSNGIPAGQDLLVQVALDAGALGATGYRLYLFYP